MASLLYVNSTQGCDLAPCFGGLKENEKLSEINQPLKMLLKRLRKKQKTKNQMVVQKRLPK